MKVFFGCTAAQIQDYKDYYLGIRDCLISEGHILTRDWLPHAWERYQKQGELRNFEPRQMFRAVKQALIDAEAVIIEDTVSNFSTGYEITFALQQNKPVLVLWLEEKYHPFERTFLHGVEADNLEIAVYNADTYASIIRRFLNKYENASERHRFNLVLGEVERKYIDWAHYTKGLSRTHLIRTALRNLIDSDEEYSQYLDNPSKIRPDAS
ncbi:MAG: hypothetical protein TR69_WS6001001294 [candidate division WS6 bacterium OLB20]|uniref:Nucleoside 2-deoxyribosyltransferase n=1 Tax=candidate division WS6 bacterium OLB20 TaxID=1617426 RepID=A0A136LWI1_9BACT|nr:MAG: hypothetical protein TR69_WS6001001294 [candidate division WS6 bacterium OLB20]